jgi:hypothetical protein
MPINLIAYPKKRSEFEIQSEVYQRLRLLGIRVRGEVIAYVDDYGIHRCEMDLVIFDSLCRAIAIIECKNYANPGNPSVVFDSESRQCRRYKLFGVPVFQCVCWDQIEACLSAVVEFSDGMILA